MRKKRFLGVRKTLARFMTLVIAATSLSVSGTFVPQSTIEVAAAETWSNSKIYVQGDEVEYNGATYRCKWWVQGGVPGSDAAWELVSGGGSGSGGTGGSGTLEGKDPTEKLDPKVGTNIQGIKLPANYYEKKVVGYFPNYALDSESHKNFSIADLQWDKLTHIQYAFAVVNKETNKIEAGDIKNDIENKFEGQTFYHDGKEIKIDESLGYYGQFNLMHTLKKMHPDVTVLISTGGWGASDGLWYATQNEAAMRTFSASAVEFIRKYGFDGIDIDFEYPSETPLSGNSTSFIESIRAGIGKRYIQFIKILSEDLAKASREDGKFYWLTSAVTASSWVLGGQMDSEFLDYFDFVSIMSYDFHGGWNNFVENQANIYPDPADGETASMDVKTLGFEWAYRFYRGKVQSEKLLMGVPYYTRGWSNVSGGTNGLHGRSSTPLTMATDELNLWYDLDENGKETPAGANPLWHVMNVMKKNPNYKRYWDDVGKVPYVWNSTNNVFVTFEDEESVQERINYVKANNLGGVLIWVMHGDYDYDAAKDEYVVGDTLTTMLYNQFKEAGASTVTSDIDCTNKVLDFDVDVSGGKYDHPNYTYSIKVKNNTGVTWPSGTTFSFWLPRSSNFTSSWGGTSSVKTVDNSFSEVTLTMNAAVDAGGTIEFTGMMKCCFSAMKNFKINGFSQMSEVNEEIKRLNRSYITEENGGTTPVEPETPTEAPTTKPVDPETPTDPVVEKPVVPFGIVWSSSAVGQLTVEMGNPANGQTYNIYIDGEFVKNVPLGMTTLEGIAGGNHTLTLTGVLNGMESEGISEQVTVMAGSASVSIKGFQISTTVEGYRTIYTVDDPNNEIVKAGLVYGLADYATPSDMVVNSTNNKVHDYAATDAGKITVPGTSSSVQNYAMTMKFIKTKDFYTANVYVRAYAQLKDGTYIYSDNKTANVNNIAKILYENSGMSNLQSHTYLYDNILKVVDPAYTSKAFDYNYSLVY